ncbi:ATP cone domain-containing protein [Chitinophaga defluvii]|uniref:ATP cone domain-containing protein n=1 Tax=Chitinophaga defluvii TaxID=3163343 RepID=A0ABV2T162_9BACT
MGSEQPAINVTKSTGAVVPFSAEKVRKSLKKAGATSAITEEIIQELYKQIYPDMPTKKIYNIAFQLLKNTAHPAAARYKLKQAIFELGPSGFPFEQFIAALFQHANFTVATNQLINGHCVKHEVDVTAFKSNRLHMIECKYHQQAGTHCDVKVPLYIDARFKDIRKKWEASGDKKTEGYQPWLVTNTRFTTDALQYGQCTGLHLLSWDFPFGKGLKDIIDNAGLYPITCLTTLSRNEKYRLLEKGIVLCQTLAEQPEKLKIADVPLQRRAIAIQEVENLCRHIVKLEWA